MYTVAASNHTSSPRAGRPPMPVRCSILSGFACTTTRKLCRRSLRAISSADGQLETDMSSLGIALFRLGLGIVRGLRDEEFRSLLFLLVLTVAGGTIFYATTEGWQWIDAVYFSVMTLLTIGAGPLEPSTTFSKVFTMIYALGGIGLMLAFLLRLATFTIKGRGES